MIDLEVWQAIIISSYENERVFNIIGHIKRYWIRFFALPSLWAICH